MSKVLKFIVNVILVLVIILLVGYIALRFTDKIRIYKVETGSMEGEIHAGDYILMLRQKEYHVGDVVTYKINEYFVTHRIMEINGDKVITKGDANNVNDKEFDISQIEGKVIYYGGILNIIINFKFVVIAVIVALYLISWYIEKEKEDKANQ